MSKESVRNALKQINLGWHSQDSDILSENINILINDLPEVINGDFNDPLTKDTYVKLHTVISQFEVMENIVDIDSLMQQILQLGYEIEQREEGKMLSKEENDAEQRRRNQLMELQQAFKEEDEEKINRILALLDKKEN